MKSYCPECGAPVEAEYNCTERFHRYLALEMADPAYGSVHHLTVAAYMLQHPSHLSRRGWRAMRDLLDQTLNQGISPERLRAKIRRTVDSGRRSWSLVKGPRLQLPAGFAWTMTILSVDDSNPNQYRLDIVRWARQALADAARVKLVE